MKSISLIFVLSFLFSSATSASEQVVFTSSDGHQSIMTVKTYSGYRDYCKFTNESEKKDIRFILKTLATKSLASLLRYKSSLEKAGARVDHLHPFRFLGSIFTDDELIAYFHAIKSRGGWVWSDFSKGIRSTLSEEMALENFKQEYIQEFSALLGLNQQVISDQFENHQWDEFLKTLITEVPRGGDPSRYDQ